MVCLHSKGFNLFTALVSFLLIALSVLLINSMIHAQRSAAERIYGEQSYAELKAVADMARSDAIQTFNYGLRKSIEDWITDPKRGGITLNLSDRTWDEIKRDFAETKFGGKRGREFAEFTASYLTGLFFATQSFGKYVISVEGDSSFEELLLRITRESVEEDDFFEVIECPDGDPRNCPKGTFYINLKVAKLNREDYERLPRIRVLDKSTQTEVADIILPRANLKIYVPLRVFKAIAEARAFAHFPLRNGEIVPSIDEGLFSARFHNLVEEMALGVCDEGYCSPRGNPFTPPATKSFAGYACPGDALQGSEIPVFIQIPQFQGLRYNASDYESAAVDGMKSVLQRMVKGLVCSLAEKAREGNWIDFAGPNDKFELVPGEECDYLRELDVIAESMPSKNIIQRNDGETPSGVPGGSSNQSYRFNACPRSPFREIGLYLEGGKLTPPGIGFSELACSGGDSSGGQAYCTEIKKISVKLWFKEMDPNYIVDKTKAEKCKRDPSKCPVYSIRLLDNSFVPFTANWRQGGVSPNCAYASEPTKTNCSFSEGWTCVSHFSEDMKTPLGCSPLSEDGG